MFEEVRLSGGRRFFFRKTSKFKTLTLRIIFEGRLDEKVEEQAVLPFLLKRGCTKYPSQRSLAAALASLFGAGLALDISKAADRQLFVASMDLVDPRFLSVDRGLVREGVELLNQVLFHPLCSGESFPEEVFAEERRNLERYVRSAIDDKILYTHLRLVEEMFRGDPFGNYEWGRLDRIARLEAGGTYRDYRRFMASAPVTIYMVGDLEEGDRPFITDGLAVRPSPSAPGRPPVGGIPASPPPPPAAPGSVVVEEYPLSQSKMEMGFHVDLDCPEDEYLALSLYSSVLGGGSFSKLFKTVREKHGLAYYVHASMDRLKGFLSVAAGIDAGDFDAVTSLVRSSMEDLAAGRVSDEEFEHAKRTLAARFLSVEDSAGQMIEFDYLTRTAGRSVTPERAARRIEAMSPSDVASVAGRIRPGCTFFLKGTGDRHGIA